MSTLREEIQKHVDKPKDSYANISELQSFNIEDPVVEKRSQFGVDKYMVVNGVYYKIPDMVIGLTKAIIAKMPNQKTFTATRTGTGKGTKYQVLPWNEQS